MANWFTRTNLRTGFLFISVAIAVFPCFNAWAEDPLLVVVDSSFTDRVDSTTREISAKYGKTAPCCGTICLWMTVSGQRWALERLREQGKLPIYHMWFRDTYGGVSPDTSLMMIDNIPLDVGREDLIGKLGVELHSRGFFDWRTWSRKENIEEGTWLVRVVYADNTPVICQDTGQGCQYRVTIK